MAMAEEPGPGGKGHVVSVEHRGMGDKGTILVVEDEESIADLIRLYLERDGFRVVWRSDGRSGLASVSADRPRLVVLDLMLPGMDGFEVTRALRDNGGHIPIIVVTAREEEADRVLGLELGADDYVTKPFSPRELVARVKAVLRRSEPEPVEAQESAMHLGSLTVDPARREVIFEGRGVELTAREFDLLSGLGLRVPRRHAHRGRAHPPVARQARRPRADPDHPRCRLQGGRSRIGVDELGKRIERERPRRDASRRWGRRRPPRPGARVAGRGGREASRSGEPALAGAGGAGSSRGAGARRLGERAGGARGPRAGTRPPAAGIAAEPPAVVVRGGRGAGRADPRSNSVTRPRWPPRSASAAGRLPA